MARPEQVAEIRQNMEMHKAELRAAMNELAEAARSWTDVGDPVRERPARWLLGAAAVGWWLGWRRA